MDDKRRKESQAKLEKIVLQIASTPGYKDLMSLPIMSKVLGEIEKKQSKKTKSQDSKTKLQELPSIQEIPLLEQEVLEQTPQVETIKEEVPVPVPVPVKEEVPVPVPVPVKEEVPVPVKEEVPVPVKEEVPVPVKEEVPIPVPVPQEVPVTQEVPVPVTQEVPVPMQEEKKPSAVRVSKKSQKTPKEKKYKKATSSDAEPSEKKSVESSPIQSSDSNDSSLTILNKMYDFMVKKHEKDNITFEDQQKFNTKVAKAREVRTKKLIGLFGGKYEGVPKKKEEKTGILDTIKDALSSLKGKGKGKGAEEKPTTPKGETPKPTTPSTPKGETPKPTTPSTPKGETPKPTTPSTPKGETPTARPAPKVPSEGVSTAAKVMPKITTGAGAAVVGGLLLPSESVAAVIDKASNMVGVDKSLMYAMAKQESGFDPNAAAKTSSATGLYQFIKGTWKSMVDKYGSKYPILKERGPEDAEANAIAGALFIKENSDYLAKNGIPVNATSVYAAHFLGPGGAKTLFAADPNKDAAQLMPKPAAANKFIFYDKSGNPRTAKQVIDVLFEKVGQYQDKYKQKLNSGTNFASVPTTPSQIPDKLPSSTNGSATKTTIIQQNTTTNLVNGGTTLAASDNKYQNSPLLDKQYR